MAQKTNNAVFCIRRQRYKTPHAARPQIVRCPREKQRNGEVSSGDGGGHAGFGRLVAPRRAGALAKSGGGLYNEGTGSHKTKGGHALRLFIAIALPPDIRRAAADTAARLRAHGAEGRFVPPENYHITLRFIGESNALCEAAEAMHSAARDCRPFLLRLSDYGAFSGKSESSTGFVTVRDDQGELRRLYETLEAALWERGFDRGRSRLMPHITLGRSITGDTGFACPRNEAFTAQGMTLYESQSVRGQMA